MAIFSFKPVTWAGKRILSMKDFYFFNH